MSFTPIMIFQTHPDELPEFLISEGPALHSTSDSVGWGDTSAVDHLDIEDVFCGGAKKGAIKPRILWVYQGIYFIGSMKN